MPPSTTPVNTAPSANTQAALNALNSYQMPTAQQTLSTAQGQYNVGQDQTNVNNLQGNVNNLQSSINAVDPSVTGRTSGTFTTEAQRQALVSAEQQPLETNLSSANTALSNGENQLNEDNSSASTLASAMLTSDQDQYQKLLDAYNASAAQDQATQQAQEFQQQLAESYYEAGNSGAVSPSYNTGDTTASTNSGSSSSNSTSKVSAEQRSDGGFNFTNSNGQAINALQYAGASGENIRDLLTMMASHGDSGAKTALTFIGNDGNADPTKITTPALANLYKAITGRTVAVYSPPVNHANTTMFGQKFSL